MGSLSFQNVFLSIIACYIPLTLARRLIRNPVFLLIRLDSGPAHDRLLPTCLRREWLRCGQRVRDAPEGAVGDCMWLSTIPLP